MKRTRDVLGRNYLSLSKARYESSLKVKGGRINFINRSQHWLQINWNIKRLMGEVR